jgi:hypothetical protein
MTQFSQFTPHRIVRDSIEKFKFFCENNSELRTAVFSDLKKNYGKDFLDKYTKKTNEWIERVKY